MNREAEICADMNAAEGAAQASLAGSSAAVIEEHAPVGWMSSLGLTPTS